MNKINNKHTRAKLLSAAAVLMLMFSGSFFVSCSKAKPRLQIPDNLVWPKPPNTPRIKFIGYVSSEEDVGGIKKKSFKDVLLGIDPKKQIKRMRQPYGICVDDQGVIYVADSGQGVVVIFDRENKKVEYLGHKGGGKLAWPLGITNDKNGNIYVSDTRIKGVLIYNPDRSFKGYLADNATLTNPAGLAYDAQRDRILVVDSKAHDVKVFTPQGKLVKKFGSRGSAEGLFNFPTNAAVGKDGYIYVVDTGNHRVQVFDKNYEYYDDFGELGTHPGQFRRPKGISLNSENHIYVMDSDFNNFQIFNQDYQILMHVGRFGKDFGQFWLPAGIFIDKNDYIYVVDTMNRRVQIFEYLKQAGK